MEIKVTASEFNLLKEGDTATIISYNPKNGRYFIEKIT